MACPKYSYPVQGIFYFFLNPSIWLRCACALLMTLLVALCSLVGFGFLMLPQVHGLIRLGCSIWLAWVVSILLYCLENCVIVLVFGLIGLSFFQENLFDYILVLRGYKYVLESEHITARPRDFRTGIGYILGQILLLVLSTPVNLIPIIGTYIFCSTNGFILAWGYQIHNHVNLRGMSFTQSQQYVLRYKLHFYKFGIIALALEMIPLFNFLFTFTNIIGAALWAADEYGKANRVARLPQGHESETNFDSDFKPKSLPKELI